MIYEVKNNTLSIIVSETVSQKDLAELDNFVNRHESQIYNVVIYGHNIDVIEYVRTLGIDWAKFIGVDYASNN